MNGIASDAFQIASSALKAQSIRMRVISENVASADATADAPGTDPYRRKTISFTQMASGGMNPPLLSVKNIGEDASPFRTEYNPSHPAADARGFVKMPNVNIEVELGDMRDANRSYQAATQIFRQARELFATTIEVTKG
jgi:flagellar basal-body rod protein FlgC